MSVVEIEVSQVLIVPIIVGLVEVAKRFTDDNRVLPILALLLGVAGAFVFPESTPPLTCVKGLVFGLAASGLWSGSKTMVKG